MQTTIPLQQVTFITISVIRIEELVQQLVEELRDHARKIQQFRMVELVDSIGNFIKRYTEISIKSMF